MAFLASVNQLGGGSMSVRGPSDSRGYTEDFWAASVLFYQRPGHFVGNGVQGVQEVRDREGFFVGERFVRQGVNFAAYVCVC